MTIMMLNMKIVVEEQKKSVAELLAAKRELIIQFCYLLIFINILLTVLSVV
jgi:hypothetical protein